MKHLLPMFMVLSGLLVPGAAYGENNVLPVMAEVAPLTDGGMAMVAEARAALAMPAYPMVMPRQLRPEDSRAAERNAAGMRAWKRSLIPVAVSQTLDVTSSYGMRELNPMLASSDGRFGAKAVSIKLGTSAALIGAEYLIIRKWPGSARVFAKLNWASSILTGSLAAHNYAIK